MTDPRPAHHSSVTTPMHAAPRTITPCASTRLEPPFRPRPRRHPTAPPTPALTAEESLALGQFIQAVTAENTRAGWRATFDQCLGRGLFRRLVTPEQTRVLRTLVERHGPMFHCYLRTTDILAAAHLPLPLAFDPTARPRGDTS